MAVTYKKPLRTIVITTIGGGTFTVADTAADAKASAALGQFEAHATMIFTVTENNATSEVRVPFHAVNNIAITVAESDTQTRKDPVCEE